MTSHANLKKTLSWMLTDEGGICCTPAINVQPSLRITDQTCIVHMLRVYTYFNHSPSRLDRTYCALAIIGENRCWSKLIPILALNISQLYRTITSTMAEWISSIYLLTCIWSWLFRDCYINLKVICNSRVGLQTDRDITVVFRHPHHRGYYCHSHNCGTNK